MRNGRGCGRGMGMGRGSQSRPARGDTVGPAEREARRSARVDSGGRREIAVVDMDKCTGCGVCVGVCQERAICMDTPVVIDPELCTGCGACVAECPNEALSLGRRMATPA